MEKISVLTSSSESKIVMSSCFASARPRVHGAGLAGGLLEDEDARVGDAVGGDRDFGSLDRCCVVGRADDHELDEVARILGLAQATQRLADDLVLVPRRQQHREAEQRLLERFGTPGRVESVRVLPDEERLLDIDEALDEKDDRRHRDQDREKLRQRRHTASSPPRCTCSRRSS